MDEHEAHPTQEGGREESGGLIESLRDRLFDEDAPVEDTLPAAQALGRSLADRGAGPADVARRVLALAHGLEDTLAVRGELDADRRRRFRRLAASAAEQALAAHTSRLLERRDGWLSFYAHELRNPLNTLANAIWILRRGERPDQVARVCDMAERAVRRLEETIRGVRELESRFPTEPPKRAGTAKKPA